jgi:hypothetical protein
VRIGKFGKDCTNCEMYEVECPFLPDRCAECKHLGHRPDNWGSKKEIKHED